MTTRKKKAAPIRARSKKPGKKVAAIAASSHEPETKPKKEQITLRLDADVIDYFRAMGIGYQGKMSSYLGVAMGDAQAREAAGVKGLPWYEESRDHEAMVNRFTRPKKEQLTLRVDADTMAFFRATGKGYQSRMNRFLRLMMVEMMRSDEPLNEDEE
jgi:uncharacterized protein (DUF4415 family)